MKNAKLLFVLSTMLAASSAFALAEIPTLVNSTAGDSIRTYHWPEKSTPDLHLSKQRATREQSPRERRHLAATIRARNTYRSIVIREFPRKQFVGAMSDLRAMNAKLSNVRTEQQQFVSAIR